MKKKYWILIVLLLFTGVYLYNLIFVSDIPITKPNVNEKKLGTLEINKDYLINYWGDSLLVDSGRIVVPEFHNDTTSNHIELFFYRIKSNSKKPSSPIVFLAGGPGSSSTAIGKTKYFYLFKELSKTRDILLIDQRGTGASIPNLHCRSFLDSPTDITENTQKYIQKDLVKSSKECAEEFANMGIKLTAYNSYQSAIDLNVIRKKLSYQKVSLYGYSYGTELAQFYLREFPENVDRMVLAGALGPDHGVKLPLEVQSQFEKMDSLVKLDKRLSKYIPNFLELVKETHKSVQEVPKFLQVPMQDAFDDNWAEQTIGNTIAIFRPSWDMMLTDDHLQMMVGEYIGNDDWISKYPSFYYKISKDNLRDVGNQLRNFRRRRLPNALFFTANAHSSYSAERWNKAIQQDKSSYLSHFGISYGRFPEVYMAFGIDRVEGMNTPVYGKQQTLFINGTLDGRTPLSLRDSLAKRFPNHKKITLENRGHNELMDERVMASIQLFLKDSLQEDMTFHYDIAFENPVPYKYDIDSIIRTTLQEYNVEKAIQSYNDLYTQHFNDDDYIYEFKSDIFHKIASDLFEEEKFDETITLLNNAVLKFPEDALLYDYLSLAYFNKGDLVKAKETSLKAFELNFFDGNAHVMLERIKKVSLKK